MKKFAADIIILYMCTRNHNHMRYSSRYTKWDRLFCYFGPLFCDFNPLPLNNPENQNFEEIKKAFGDVIILNLCNKKHDHMIYAYTDIECLHRHIFLSFRPFFALLAHLWSRKLKNVINIWRYYHLIIWSPDIMYGSWDIKFNRQNYFVILGKFLSFYSPPPPPPPPPLTTQKMKISKIKKNPGDIIILHMCTKNHDHPLYCSRDVVRDEFNSYFHLGLYFSLLPL